MAGGEPFANLGGIHQRSRHFTIGNVPDILLADASSDDELDGAELIFPEWIEGMFECVLEAVVKGDDDMGWRWRERTVSHSGVEGDRFESGALQFSQLSGQKFATEVETFEASATRPRTDFVIGENGKTRIEKLAKGCQ